MPVYFNRRFFCVVKNSCSFHSQRNKESRHMDACWICRRKQDDTHFIKSIRRKSSKSYHCVCESWVKIWSHASGRYQFHPSKKKKCDKVYFLQCWWNNAQVCFSSTKVKITILKDYASVWEHETKRSQTQESGNRF